MKKNRLYVGIILVLYAVLQNSFSAYSQVWTFSGITQERVVGQVPTTARQGFQNINALRINMLGVGTTSGVTSSLTFNGFSFSFTGTNSSDISNASIYFSSTANPNNSNVLYGQSNVIGNLISFSGNQNFTNLGNYFFWVTVNINQDAIVGNSIQLEGLSITINGVSYDISTTTLTGTTTISANSPLSGIYTVDATNSTSGNNFTTIANMVSSINTNGIGENGATFIFKDGQTFNVGNPGTTMNFVTNPSDNKKVLFTRSNDGTIPPIILGTDGGATEDALLGFVGWSNVTINGLNFNTTGSTPFSYGVFFRSTGQRSCNNNVVANCLFDFSGRKNLEAPGNNFPNAIYFNARETTSNLCVANNNTIYNNTIIGMPRAISIRGNTNNISTRNTENSIFNNYITDVTATGIQMEFVGTAKIYNNIIENISINGFISGDGDGFVGIRAEGLFSDSYIYNNIIRNISNTFTTTNSVRLSAMSLGQRNNSFLYVFNNIITNIQLPNVSNVDTYTSRFINLADNGSFPSGFYRFFNNSFVNDSRVSFAVVFSNGVHSNNSLEFRNNIFIVNTITGSVSSVIGVLYGTKFGNTNMLSSNSRNNIYFSNNNNFTFYRSGNPVPTSTTTGFNTFAQYRASRIGEQTSQFSNLNFININSLQLDNSNPGTGTILGSAITIPGIGFQNDILNIDINGYLRNPSMPTIGANELLTVVSGITVEGQSGMNFITDRLGNRQINAIVSPSNATYQNLVWSASPSNIATISGTGVLQALGIADGVVTVRATATDGSKVFGEATITVTGQVLVSNISLTGANITSYQGTSQMTATVAPANASNKNVSWMVDNTSLATISGTGELKAVGGANGVVMVSAMSLDAASVVGAAMVTVSGQIIATSVSISAPEYVLTTFGSNLQFTETVLPANAENKSVSWSVSNTSVATISGTGLLSALGNGVVTVTAMTQDGSMLSDSKVVTLSGQTRVSSISLSVNEGINVLTVKGATLTLTPTVLPADAAIKAVTWSVNAQTVATISGAGVLQSLSDGVVTVTATATDGSGVVGSLPLTITGQVLVSTIVAQGQGAVSSISTRGGSLQINATVLPSNASFRAITWSVSDISIATISGTGLLKALADGVVTVTASATDASGVVGRTTIQITNQVAVSSIVVSPSTGSIATKGGVLALSAEVLPANASNNNFTWSVSNNLIATISGTGILVARADGVVTVTATALDGSGVRGTSVVTVTNQVLVTNIVIQPQGGQNTISTQGGTIQFSAVVSPGNASVRSVSWSVSDAALASVSGSGLVEALGDGVVTVTASALDASGISRAFVITITNQVLVSLISISGANGATSISEKAGTLQLEFVVSPANASDKTLNITVSDTNVVSFNENTGLITAKANGVVTITAVAADASGVSNTIVIEVTNQESATVNTGNLKGVSVYPVPNSGTFFVKTPATGTLSIFNSQGVVVYSKAVSSGENKVEGLHSGIFTVLVSSSEGSASFKIVVE